MSDDLLEKRFEEFLDALREHFRVSLEYQDPDDKRVLVASDAVEDTFYEYDSQLYDELDIELPLDIFDFADYQSQAAQRDVDQFIKDINQNADLPISRYDQDIDIDEQDDYIDLAPSLFDSAEDSEFDAEEYDFETD